MIPEFGDLVPADDSRFPGDSLPNPELAFSDLEVGQQSQAIRAQYSYAQISQSSLRIKDLPISERPRDRLFEHGAKNLSTSELLSILLGTGQGAGGLSAVGLGQLILQRLSESQTDPLKRFQDVTFEEANSNLKCTTSKSSSDKGS